jgi:ribosomal protein S18 acetylase RimI-like enzyme
MASMLVQRMYASRGYITETAKQRLDDPNRVTLAAWQYDEVIATLTLGRDSPSGLLADTLYAPEVAGLRRPDRIVCEVTRLAVDPDFASRELLLSLFRAAHKYGKELFAASDVVIEVNPRHVGYYQRLLGFKQLGELRHCPRVAAPAVLLHQDLKHLTFPNGKPSWGERSHIDLHTHTHRSDRV